MSTVSSLILQPPLQTDARSKAHIDGRLSAIDLTPILVYRMASLVDSAVLSMAEISKGWREAPGEGPYN